MPFKLFMLAALVKLVLSTQNFWLGSGIYTALALALALLFGPGLIAALLVAAVVFALSTLYFWLLVKLEGAELAWWTVCILGFPIVLI